MTLTDGLLVDLTTPNVACKSKAQIPGGLLPAGLTVDSYYVHTNVTNAKVSFLAQYLGFSQEERIVALIVTTPNLRASDAILGAPNTAYDKIGAGIGLHFYPVGSDGIVIQPASSSNAFTNFVKFQEVVGNTSVTDFRVVTEVMTTAARSSVAVPLKL